MGLVGNVGTMNLLNFCNHGNGWMVETHVAS
jgi:hypothetical protein